MENKITLNKEDLKNEKVSDFSRLLLQTERFVCPTHGDIGEEVVKFHLIEGNNPQTKILCNHCWLEMFVKNGVCEAKLK